MVTRGLCNSFGFHGRGEQELVLIIFVQSLHTTHRVRLQLNLLLFNGMDKLHIGFWLSS